MVIDNLNIRAAFFKRFLEIRVHVAGNRFNAIHPFLSNEIDEVIHDLLLFSFLNPEDVPPVQIDDMGCKLVPVMQLEFVYRQMTSLLLRLFEGFPVYGIEPLKPLFINTLDNRLMKPGQRRNFLVGITSTQQFFRVSQQFHRDPVMLRLERYGLHDCLPAFRAHKSVLIKQYKRKLIPDAYVPKLDMIPVMYLHPTAAVPAYVVILVIIQISVEAIRFSAAGGYLRFSSAVHEICQGVWYQQHVWKICT